MKKFILLTLVVAMVFSMTACGCNHQWAEATCTTPKTCTICGETEGQPHEHTPGELTVTSVDTAALTVNYVLPCADCGYEIETKTSSTSVAPTNGAIQLTPQEWFDCFTTNTQMLGAGQVLVPHPIESEDGAVLNGLVSMAGMTTAFSYRDAEDTIITTENKDTRGLVHNICIEAQFTNDSAQHFFMMLMIVLINNNASLDYNDANTYAAAIMQGEVVTDNGYSYAMQIQSVENHTVLVSITAE